MINILGIDLSSGWTLFEDDNKIFQLRPINYEEVFPILDKKQANIIMERGGYTPFNEKVADLAEVITFMKKEYKKYNCL